MSSRLFLTQRHTKPVMQEEINQKLWNFFIDVQKSKLYKVKMVIFDVWNRSSCIKIETQEENYFFFFVDPVCITSILFATFFSLTRSLRIAWSYLVANSYVYNVDNRMQYKMKRNHVSWGRSVTLTDKMNRSRIFNACVNLITIPYWTNQRRREL